MNELGEGRIPLGPLSPAFWDAPGFPSRILIVVSSLTKRPVLASTVDHLKCWSQNTGSTSWLGKIMRKGTVAHGDQDYKPCLWAGHFPPHTYTLSWDKSGWRLSLLLWVTQNCLAKPGNVLVVLSWGGGLWHQFRSHLLLSPFGCQGHSSSPKVK